MAGSVDTKMFPKDYVPKVGDKVEIAYSGGILETYPAMFGDIAHIELLDKNHDILMFFKENLDFIA